MKLLHTNSELQHRHIAIMPHLRGRFDHPDTVRMPTLLKSFGELWLLEDDSVADCIERGIDTVLAMEYVDHDDARRQAFRDAGIHYWHYALPYASHYAGDRFDWALYTEDTFQRAMTSQQYIATKPALQTDAEIKSVLIVGQIQSDQSLAYGGNGYNSSTLVAEVSTILPNAKLTYRPHPKCVALQNKEFTADITWYPDPMLSDPIDGVEISVTDDWQMKRPYAKDLARCDAVVTINSTAGYEALMAGRAVYHAGIPPIHEHPSGVFRLSELTDGIKLVNEDYQTVLTNKLNSIQSTGVYEVAQYLNHEYLLRTYYAHRHIRCAATGN